jgi:hypothetical protein
LNKLSFSREKWRLVMTGDTAQSPRFRHCYGDFSPNDPPSPARV